MNKIVSYLLLLATATATLGSCKKEEPDFNVVPKSQIVFDDNINKTAGDFPKAGNVTLKVGVGGAATSVRITSTYSGKSVVVNSYAVSGGVAAVSFSTAQLRIAADGPIIGSGPVPATLPPGLTAASYGRPANTYVLRVDAVSSDGSSERRFFTAVALL